MTPITFARDSGGLASSTASDLQKYGNVAFFALHLFSGIISGSAVLFLVFNSSLRKHKSARMLLPACMAEMFSSGLSMCFHAYIGYYGSIEMLSGTACNVWGVVLYIGIPLSLWFNAAITFERHRAVVSQGAHSKIFSVISGGLLAFTFVVALIRAFVGHRYKISTAKLYCMAEWTSSDPADRILNGLGLILDVMAFGCLVFYQFRIFLIYRRTQEALNFVCQDSPVHDLNQQTSAQGKAQARAQERALLFRMGILSTLMAISWTPLFLMLLHDMVTGQPLGGMFDFVACLVFIVAQVMMPVVLALSTPVVKKALVDYFCVGGEAQNVRTDGLKKASKPKEVQDRRLSEDTGRILARLC